MTNNRIIIFILVLSLILPNITITSFAAENTGIAVKVSSESVNIGEEVTVTVSLKNYDLEAEPIRGIQIDVTGIDTSILDVEDGSYISLIEDSTATSNKAVYQQSNDLLRLIYVKMTGTLEQPYEDVFQMTFRVNSKLTEAGSITLPLIAKIQTTESRLTIKDEITISYRPAEELPPPDIVSVDIDWGDMNYTYTDGNWNTETHSYDNSGWSDGETGYVRIRNTGGIDTSASFSYVSYLDEVVGDFTDGKNSISGSIDIASGQSQTAYLFLRGKPKEELSNITIGTITVKMGGE